MLPKTKTKNLAEKVGFLEEEKSAWEKSRPSLNDIQDWIRDNFNIHCYVYPMVAVWRKEDNAPFKGEIIDVNQNFQPRDFVNHYGNSYYDCLEKCIIKCLRIIRDAKEKEKQGEAV